MEGLTHDEQKELVANLSRRFVDTYPEAKHVQVTVENGYATVDVRFIVPYLNVKPTSLPSLPQPSEDNRYSDWGPYR